MVYDPLWIIQPTNEQNLVSLLRTDEKHPAAFVINGFVETISDHHSGYYPVSQLSGFVQARPQVAGAQ